MFLPDLYLDFKLLFVDPTYSSLVNLASKTQVPFIWEDAEDFNCLGKLVMLIYNDVSSVMIRKLFSFCFERLPERFNTEAK